MAAAQRRRRFNLGLCKVIFCPMSARSPQKHSVGQCLTASSFCSVLGTKGLPRSGLMACATKTRVNSYELSIGHSLPILGLRDASFFLDKRHSCANHSRYAL